MNTHFSQGLRDARSALGTRWPLTAAASAVIVLAIAGVLEGQAAGNAVSARSAQLHLLEGVAFGLVLPLFAFAVSARLGGGRQELMAHAWARYGGDRRVYALGRQSLAALLAGLVAATAGVLALGLGSATSAPGIPLPTSLVNVLMVIWIGLLGGLCYVVAFGLAYLYAGNVGRLLFLFGDWLLGSTTSTLAMPWPRSHLRALLGGAAPLDLSARDAALCLGAIALLSSFAYLRRLPR